MLKVSKISDSLRTNNQCIEEGMMNGTFDAIFLFNKL